MWEQCDRVGVRLYPLRGCVSVTVCVLGFAENVVGSVCANLSVWEHLSVWISPCVCANMHMCVCDEATCGVSRLSGVGRVSPHCRVECILKVLRIICFMEKKRSAKAFYQFLHAKSLDHSTQFSLMPPDTLQGWIEWLQKIISRAV